MTAVVEIHNSKVPFYNWSLALAAQYGHLDLVEFLYLNRNDVGNLADAKEEVFVSGVKQKYRLLHVDKQKYYGG